MRSSVGVLILNFNGMIHLENCIESVLAATTSSTRVYLVDNNSTDGSVDFVRETYPEVRIIRYDQNYGFARAYNLAARQISEDMIVFLNNDVEVDNAWLKELVEVAERSDRVAACGSKLLLYDNRKLVDHAGGLLSPIGGGHDVGLLNVDSVPTEPRFAGCVKGASMLVKRSVFLNLGGFDEDFFAYFEDADLCWRIWLEGYQVMFVPRSIVYHKLGASWGAFDKPERAFLGQRNRLQSLLKNLGIWNLFPALFAFAIYTFMRIVRFLSSGEYRSVKAVAQAYWWVLRNMPELNAKRQEVQKRRRVKDSFLFREGLMSNYLDGLREFLRLSSLRARYPQVFRSIPENLQHHSRSSPCAS